MGLFALLGTALAFYAGEWIAALFAGCAAAAFSGATRMMWDTSSRPAGARPGPPDAELHPFRFITGKKLLLLLVGGFVVGGIISGLVGGVGNPDGTGYEAAALAFGLYGFVAIGLWVVTRRHGVDFQRITGTLPQRADLVRILSLVVPLLLFSYGTVWIVYYPLSLVSPGLVDAFLSQEDIFSISRRGGFAFGPHLLTAIGLVVLAPVTEEIFFRGFLLHRWALMWGVESAVIGSTVVFAILHFDPLGAAAFGFAMAVIYVKTGSLLAVILCHVLNNFVAYATGLVYTLFGDGDTSYTVAEFHAEWWTAAVCLVLAAPWVVWFVRKNWPNDSWAVPYGVRGERRET